MLVTDRRLAMQLAARLCAKQAIALTSADCELAMARPDADLLALGADVERTRRLLCGLACTLKAIGR